MSRPLTARSSDKVFSLQPRPWLLDLFCGAGGAAMGYFRAGFDVVGIDIRPQPNYPFTFIQMEAFEAVDQLVSWGLVTDGGDRILPQHLAAVHASPPCQKWTAYRRRPEHVGFYPDLVGLTRERLRLLGLPYVIENLPSAPLGNPVILCGSSFGLDVRRHRGFEASFPPIGSACAHDWQTPRFAQATNRKNKRSTVEIGVWRIPLVEQRRAMGIDWMTLEELSEAVPPAYTEFMGAQLMHRLAEPGKQRRGPLRRIVRLIRASEGLFDRARVELECGHTIVSDGIFRARCSACAKLCPDCQHHEDYHISGECHGLSTNDVYVEADGAIANVPICACRTDGSRA